jgi:acyl carrier protein
MKAMETTVPKLIQIIVDKLGVDQNLLSYKTSFSDNLGADSLDVYELILSVEKEFKLKINEDDIEKLTTVGALMDYVESKVAPNKQQLHTMVVVSKELQEDSVQNVLLPASQN